MFLSCLDFLIFLMFVTRISRFAIAGLLFFSVRVAGVRVFFSLGFKIFQRRVLNCGTFGVLLTLVLALPGFSQL